MTACHEGALGLVDGKATLLRDDFCDGMGDCLPACPADAISFVEREATAYDEAAVAAAKAAKEAATSAPTAAGVELDPTHGGSMLAQWPCEIKLIPVQAPYFQACDLLIAADCTAYAMADFHERFMKGRNTLIGCPKLDGVDYSEKLTQIFALNDIKSITLTRMEVPCCGGLERAVKMAIAQSGKNIPLHVATIACLGGDILHEE